MLCILIYHFISPLVTDILGTVQGIGDTEMTEADDCLFSSSLRSSKADMKKKKK